MKDFTHPYLDSYHYFPEIDSTNVKALEMVKNREIQGNFLVTAESQKKGMGRGKNNWISPNGGLWFTLGLFGMPISSNLTIFTGMILHKMISNLDEELALHLKIKWPNDLYFKDKKIVGILSNYLSNFRYHLIGCGINSNNPISESELNAVSICEVLGKEISNYQLLYSFLTSFFQELPIFIENGLDLSYYSEYDYLRDKNISISTDYEIYSGKCKGITRDGAILLQLPNGSIQPFYAGSISVDDVVA